jgi:hypothetical protein
MVIVIVWLWCYAIEYSLSSILCFFCCLIRIMATENTLGERAESLSIRADYVVHVGSVFIQLGPIAMNTRRMS